MKKTIVAVALILTTSVLSSQTIVSNSKQPTVSVELPHLLSVTAKKDLGGAD